LNFIPARPVLHRELLVASRSKRTHQLRFLMGLIALVGVSVALVVMSHLTIAAGGGKELLTMVSVAAYGYCLMMGFSLTLGAIRDERDQGTLSLLFLTSLRGGQIVFAKLFARSLRTFEGLLAILPVFALCLLLGGVTMGEFARIGLGLVNALFVSACLGMYISSKRLQLAASAFLAGTLVFALGVVAPFLANLLAEEYKLPTIGLVAGSITPFFPIQHFEDASQGDGIYWASLCVSFLSGVWFLMAAIRSVRGNWQDKPNQTKKQRRLKEFQNWDFKSASRDPVYRATLLDQNPICWLNSRDRFRSTGYWIYFALIYGLLAFAWALLGHHDSPLPFFWFAALMFDFGIWAKLNQAAGIQLVEERKLGSLEMILCAPVGLPRILSGLWMALRRQFGPVLLASTGVNFALTLLIMAMHADSRGMAREAAPATIFWVFLYYTMANISLWIALAWVGMWFGLRNKPDSPMASFGLVRVLARPWFFLSLAFVILFILELFGMVVFKHMSPSGWVVLFACIAAGSNVLYVRKAKGRIPQAFQLAATGTLDEPHKPQPAKASAFPSKGDSLLTRLWRRRFLRWAAPAAVIALVVLGNRWLMHREYQQRVARLHQNGVATTLDGLYAKVVARLPTDQPTAIQDAYNQFQPTILLRRAIRDLESPNVKAKRRAESLALLRGHVETNRPALTTLQRALPVTGSAFPPETESYNSSRVRGLANLDQLLRAAFYISVEDGNRNAAYDCLFQMIQHGSLRSQTGSLLWTKFRNGQITRLHSDIPRALDLGSPDRTRLDALQQELLKLRAEGPDYRETRVECICARLLEFLELQDPDELLADLFYSSSSRVPLKEKLRFGLFRLTGGVERMRLQTLDLAQAAAALATDPSPARWDAADRLLNEQEPGNFPYMLFRAFNNAITAFYDSELRLNLCIAAVATERYRLDHEGRSPRTLEELYPLYLKAIPINPISGRPLVLETTETSYTIGTQSDQDFFELGNQQRIENARITVQR